MTQISPQTPLRRETSVYYRGRPLIVELHPGYLTLREKGRREAVAVDYRAILDLGYKIKARADRQEKLERRKKGNK